MIINVLEVELEFHFVASYARGCLWNQVYRATIIFKWRSLENSMHLEHNWDIASIQCFIKLSHDLSRACALGKEAFCASMINSIAAPYARS